MMTSKVNGGWFAKNELARIGIVGEVERIYLTSENLQEAAVKDDRAAASSPRDRNPFPVL